MQPKTCVKFDEKTYLRHRDTIQAIAQTRRMLKKNPFYASPLPLDIGIQMTRRCNLRCKTCFLWNNDGIFRYFGKTEREIELDTSIIEKVLRETREAKSRLYLWATEPLFHKQWDDIAALMVKDPRWVTICTNGILIDKKIETLLPLSENLAIVISLDGFEKEHDAIRGKGAFAKTMENARLLLALQKKGEYKGKITFHCVLNDDIIPHLYEFTGYCEKHGIDSLYLGFPWYISEDTCREMDDYYKEYFSWLNNIPGREETSWSRYTFHIKQEMIPILKKQLRKLLSREFNMRIRLQPPLEINEIEDYLVGKTMPVQYSAHCYSPSNRMDILANGDVTTCQPFHEFTVGNLYKNSLVEIWRGEKFNRVRETLTKGLTPVCSKCILLYLHSK